AAVVFANPDFTMSSHLTIVETSSEPSNTKAGAIRGSEKKHIEDLGFGPLGGTKKECDKLRITFDSWHWKADFLTGKNATKETLLQIHSPYILHLATHGFFKPEDQSDPKSAESHPV